MKQTAAEFLPPFVIRKAMIGGSGRRFRQIDPVGDLDRNFGIPRRQLGIIADPFEPDQGKTRIAMDAADGAGFLVTIHDQGCRFPGPGR